MADDTAPGYMLTARVLHWCSAHIGAALFHHFVRKDRVLMRMVSG